LDGWLIADIALGESLIGRAIDALARTSPELGEKRDHRDTRERSDSSFAEDTTDTQLINYISTLNEFIIPLDHRNM
jgi:hypothetical protein